MIPGPTYVYACPDCQLRVTKGSLASFNTFGATHYSDLRIDAPMRPSFPEITKCERCDCIFWLDEETQVEGVIKHQMADFYNDTHQTSEVKNPAFGDQFELHPAKELDQDDLKDALLMKVYRDLDEEHYLRRHLLWTYHKQLENGTLTREELNENKAYLANIQSFFHLIEADPDSRPFQAELMRFAGKFELALEILEPYVDEYMGPILGRIHERCLERNRDVFTLD